MPAFENLRIHMVHGENSKTAAFVSCKIITEAGALFLNSMALVRGANGLYLSFPSRKRDGQPVKGFEDYYYMERGLKELVQVTAIDEFKARCAEMGIDAEKASAPLPPGSHADDDDEHSHPPREHREPRERAPREPREPRDMGSRQPFINESRPVFGNGASGGYRGAYGDRGGGGGGGYRGNNGGGGYGGDRGGSSGGGYRGSNNGGGGYGGDRGGSGGGYRGSNNGGGGGYGGDRGGSSGGYRGSNNGGGGYGGDRGGSGGGYRGSNNGGGGGGYRGNNGGGGFGDNRGNSGFPTGANLANRPLSSRFNPYTGNSDLQVEKPAPTESQQKNVQDEGEE